ncbi:hypothetical protein [Halodesulfovibrio marinisediminis]|uniref:Outer membrane efflux protein n=1 Tax=Halodesulfovibrio marinisediminis DSM 17456 TaxID=1121457 RepID=A0A1N6IXX4_9BACT|nr:hypothetical protein [Halodesulfovibrio marinisediminis]SIO36890.1 hypothetical protein SAMN02745161_3041 [Halodesulfovibrio marinisediminis DSM 17456]
MCSVVGVGVLLSVAASAVASNQGSAKIKTSGYAVNTAPVDAYAAQQKASYALAEGERNVERERRNYLQSEGRIQSTFAANNVSLASGSALDLLVNNRAYAQERMNDIRYESEIKAWEYDVAKTKAEARSVTPRQSYERDSWEETLSDPLFLIQSAQKGLSLFK